MAEPSEPVRFVIREETTLEKYRDGEATPYEVVHTDAEGNVTVARRDDDRCR